MFETFRGLSKTSVKICGNKVRTLEKFSVETTDQKAPNKRKKFSSGFSVANILFFNFDHVLGFPKTIQDQSLLVESKSGPEQKFRGKSLSNKLQTNKKESREPSILQIYCHFTLNIFWTNFKICENKVGASYKMVYRQDQFFCRKWLSILWKIQNAIWMVEWSGNISKISVSIGKMGKGILQTLKYERQNFQKLPKWRFRFREDHWKQFKILFKRAVQINITHQEYQCSLRKF